ncbi:MAG: beta-N-acetylhexosaminidase [Chloroflexi bacterium]|nr:beta-N-acetylhexosaminidase [Chloroflexota bacterium]
MFANADIPPLIPRPAAMERYGDDFELASDTAIVADAANCNNAAYLRDLLAAPTGFSLPIVLTPLADAPTPAKAIRLKTDPAQAGGREGYRLDVTPETVEITAAAPTGVFYGIQTLQQLLPIEIERRNLVSDLRWRVPGLVIRDAPRFPWRGFMLDQARYFHGKATVLRLLDLMALHKLNVFHWHLTDDQGWRIEIKKYPRLTEVGGWRRETVVGRWREDEANPPFDGARHGGFYTQDEVREVVAYAAGRGITTLPEIEMPGHAQAAIAAYPELGNTGQQLDVATRWGIIENVYNVEEHTIRFLQDVLDEVMDLFPSQFIHIGGDEVPKKQWRESAAAQRRIQELGLKDEDALQSYFVHRMDAFLAGRGRRLVGWEEILEGGLAPGATIMSWRGEQGGIAAALAGHDVVMTPTHWTYFDYYQSQETNREPLAIGGYVPLEKVYIYEPIPAAIDPIHAHHVLGTQAQLWTEYVPTPEHIEYMTFPRLCALAEVAWSPVTGKDYPGFLNRLRPHLERLRLLGVHFRPLDV